MFNNTDFRELISFLFLKNTDIYFSFTENNWNRK